MADSGERVWPPLGAVLPEGTRFIGPVGLAANWRPGEAPSDDDLATCVACGLCLPHCPTYRLTGEESASPRGRIAAMRAVAEGRANVDTTFARFMDLCLECRACEDVCPSHVPFGRMMERARVQIEPLRTRRARLVRWLGLNVALRRRWVLSLVRRLTPVARPFLRKRVRSMVPRGSAGRRVPTSVEAEGPARGTVAILTGCVQDQWYRPANRATVRVLARNGWRVIAPRRQTCCGAIQAHNGGLGTARKLARRNLVAFDGADWVVVAAAGCGAHLKDYGDLLGAEEAIAFSGRVRDLMEFLDEQGVEPPVVGPGGEGPFRVAYHDACHALRAQRIKEQPRSVLRAIPGVEIVDIPDGDRCCGAAGLYNVLEPQMSDQLMEQKAASIASIDATIVASANPGCSMHLATELSKHRIEVRHPMELVAEAIRS
ncbi:MAG TPA: (Fe-S)-binding protein [Actinomycetota bacterium]